MVAVLEGAGHVWGVPQLEGAPQVRGEAGACLEGGVLVVGASCQEGASSLHATTATVLESAQLMCWYGLTWGWGHAHGWGHAWRQHARYGHDKAWSGGEATCETTQYHSSSQSKGGVLCTWVRHHVLCLLLQPVHVVQLHSFLVLASRVVSLAY